MKTKRSGDLCREGTETRGKEIKELATFAPCLFTGPILPPWAWWQLTVARRPQTPFFFRVQQNNCIVFYCQKLAGWNKIAEQGTVMETQGFDGIMVLRGDTIVSKAEEFILRGG